MTTLKPAMTDNEIRFLESYFGKCSHYFEFGCGGSTYNACKHSNIQTIESVESSQQWINKLSSNPLISSSKNKIQFHYIDINADNNKFGRPKDSSKKQNWALYSRQINKTPKKYDLVLIDGRFRVACALHTLDSIDPSGIVLIHDYTNRPYYYIVEKFYNRVAVVEKLCAFQKKPAYDQKLLKQLIAKYEHICD